MSRGRRSGHLRRPLRLQHQGQCCHRARGRSVRLWQGEGVFQPDPAQRRRAGGDPAAGAIPAAVDLLPVAGELEPAAGASRGDAGTAGAGLQPGGDPQLQLRLRRQAQQPGAGLWRTAHQVDPEICRHEPGGEQLGPAQPAEPAGGGDRRQGAGWCAALVPRLQRRGWLPAHRRQAQRAGGRLATPTTCSDWWPATASTPAR